MLTTKVVSNKKPPLLSDSESGGSTSLLLNIVVSRIKAYLLPNASVKPLNLFMGI